MNKRTLIKIIVSVFVSLLFIFLLLKLVNIDEIKTTFAKLSFPTFVYAFFIYSLAYLIRAVRTILLLNKKIKLTTAFNITSVHEMMAQVIPLRLGEATFVILTKKFTKCKFRDILSVYVLFRFLDIVSITLLFVITFITVRKNVIPTPVYFAVFTLLLILFLSAVIFWRFWGVVSNILKNKKSRISRINQLKERIIDLFDTIYAASKRNNFITLTALSLLLWLTHFYTLFLILKNIGVCFPFSNMILASGLAGISAIIPIPNVAGIGTMDSLWTAVFILFGVNKTTAISSTILLHTLTIIFYATWGLIGGTILSRQKISLFF